MDFVWNDGGRAASGFVGTTGDCVARSIAIATGTAYRDVYDQLGAAAAKSPRQGVATEIAAKYLEQRGWKQSQGNGLTFQTPLLPEGVVVVHLSKRNGLCNHLCAVIDQVVHDTWNPADDDYIVRTLWTPPHRPSASPQLATAPKRRVSRQQELTQKEFDRVMRILRALDKTANNQGSTEGEKHNALRAMQHLMLENNLTRDDILDDDNVDQVQFTRMTCHVNGRRACSWEKELAHYICGEILPSVQWYLSTKGHRSLFIFYGPLADVRNAIALFRELLLTIATAARLQFGGHSRGSGASYAEGYVEALPKRSQTDIDQRPAKIISETALVQTRTLALQSAATDWLAQECNIRLVSSSRSGRQQHDPFAQHRGRQHGAQHQVNVPNAPKRLS